MADNVLVAYDGSDQAKTALEYAIEHFDAALTVIMVIDPADTDGMLGGRLPATSEALLDEAEESARKRLEEAEAFAEERGVEVETVSQVGKPANTVVEYAEKNEVDQIVVGSHGRSGISRILLGSVAETVMRRSPVPVTVVR